MAREYVQLLPEVEKIDTMRLGRHIEFWQQAQDYAVEAENRIEEWVEEHLFHKKVNGKTTSTVWERRCPIFNQGNLGSCTGNAAAGAKGSDSKDRTGDASANEPMAVDLYSIATRKDVFPGQYEPDDTGSSGTGVCKALRVKGWINEYRWAFSTAGVLTALKTGPVMLGVAWVTSMDEPDGNGRVGYSGMVRGGHEFLCRGFDASEGLFVMDNSWDTSYGDNGHFYMNVADFTAMLKNNGDVKLPLWV